MRFATVWSEAEIVAIAQATLEIRLFTLAPREGALAYAPGSHVEVAVEVDGQPQTRSYSLVGLPDGRHYRIAVKHEPEGRGGSAYLWRLAPGARLAVSTPQNLFEMDFGRPETLLVAGGIGITPILGMAQVLAARGERIRLAYCGRSREAMAFTEELAAALGDRLDLYVSAEGRRLDLARVISELHPRAQLLLCGPLRLIEAARTAWSDAGRDPTLLRFETFGASGRLPTVPFRVAVPAFGREIEVPANRSLLDALEEAGIGVVSDCRRGECGLCVLDVEGVEGVIDHRDVFFSEAERAEGHKICACVSRVHAEGGGGRLVLDVGYRPDKP